MELHSTGFDPYIKPGDRLRLTGVDGLSGDYVVTEVRQESFVTMLEVLPRGNLRWVLALCVAAFWLGFFAAFVF